jgi:tetratricopeptide (TPR) repeat protein
MEVAVEREGSHLSLATFSSHESNTRKEQRHSPTSVGGVIVLSVLAGALAAWMLVGCSDVLTYSDDARVQGMKLYDEHNYADAAGAFRDAIRQNPRVYSNYYSLGQCYDQMGKWHESIAAYRSGWDVCLADLMGKKDTHYQGLFVDGLSNAIAQSDTRDQETDAAVDRAKDRQSANDYLLLAKIYVYRSDADSAIDAFGRAASIDPNRFDIAKEYGLYLVKLGQGRRAEVPLRNAYALNSNDADVNAALRQIGIVPGPSLKDQDALAHPLVPKGPIPSVDIPTLLPPGASNVGPNAPAASPSAPAAAAAPQD